LTADAKPTSSKDPPALRYLDPEQVRVFRSEDGRLRATIAGERSVIAPRFLRAQPLTDPDRYIAIREADPGGKEVGLLRQWRRLDPQSRDLLQAELDRRYLHPVVKRILSVKSFWGLTLCVFETDRGVREATLREVRDNVIYLGEARVLLTDAEGNRYDIPDLTALDPASRALLTQIL
jgi:hypothetical protein